MICNITSSLKNNDLHYTKDVAEELSQKLADELSKQINDQIVDQLFNEWKHHYDETREDF